MLALGSFPRVGFFALGWQLSPQWWCGGRCERQQNSSRGWPRRSKSMPAADQPTVDARIRDNDVIEILREQSLKPALALLNRPRPP